jgi:hypothetical protein
MDCGQLASKSRCLVNALGQLKCYFTSPITRLSGVKTGSRRRRSRGVQVVLQTRSFGLRLPCGLVCFVSS